MSRSDPVAHNIEVAQRVQEQFELYFLALTFTILGLAVQTASTAASALATGLELIGWLLLFAGGIAGLVRAETKPNFFGLMSRRIDREGQIAEYRSAGLSEDDLVFSARKKEQVSLRSVLDDQESFLASTKNEMEQLEARMRTAYLTHRVTFVFGVAFLMLARGVGLIWT